MTDEDPLAGADAGETRTVQEAVTIETINFAPNSLFRGDCDLDDYRVADIELVEDADGNQNDIRVVYEGELTKRPEPAIRRVRAESTTETTHAYRENGIKALAWEYLKPWLGYGTGVVLAAAAHNQLATELTINGQQAEPVGAIGVALITALVVFFHTLLKSGIQRVGGEPA